MKTRVSPSHRRLSPVYHVCASTDCALCVCVCELERERSVLFQAQKGNESLSQAGILSACSVSVATQPIPTASVKCLLNWGWTFCVFACACVYLCYQTMVNPMVNLRAECSSVAFEVCNVIIKLCAPFKTNMAFVMAEHTGSLCRI